MGCIGAKFILLGRLLEMRAKSHTNEVIKKLAGEYGFLNPILAAAAMALSSVTVLTNALRLRQTKIH